VQLQSFRTEDLIGPALSDAVEVDFPIERVDAPDRYSLSVPARFSMKPAAIAHPGRVVQHSACIREKRPLSNAQFIDAIISMLPQLLPVAGGVVSSLVNPGAAPPAGTPSWVGGLVDFVRQLMGQAGSPRTPASAATGASGGTATPQFPSQVAVQTSTFSNAMIAPALIAALPAIMPLLQQVLNPQTIQSVLQTADPNRLIGTISNAIQGFAQLGIQNNELERAHLRALNPGVDDPAFSALLAGLSLNLDRETEDKPAYRRTNRAALHFADAATVPLQGRGVVAYLHGVDWQFPLSLETRKAVPPGVLRVTLKHAATLDRIARFRARTPPFGEGRLSLVPSFAASDLSGLRGGEEYLVQAELTWKDKAGESIGIMRTQLVRALSEFTFDSVQEGGEIVALNDVDRHRDFWHKVWGGLVRTRRGEARVRVQVLLPPKARRNGE
jgi:hypothetical protein